MTLKNLSSLLRKGMKARPNLASNHPNPLRGYCPDLNDRVTAPQNETAAW